MLLVWILKGVTTVSVSVGMLEMEQNALVRNVTQSRRPFNGRSAQEQISLPTTATLFNPRNADTPLFRKADEFL